jgi:Uma2 family endonuclease
LANFAFPPATKHPSIVTRPDCDFVNGQLRERTFGEYDHGRVQIALGAMLFAKQREWRIRVATEVRLQVGENRSRVTDICVHAADAPIEQIVRHPPILCIEVLSPDDRIADIRDRISDYAEMGVARTWLIDFLSRSVIVCASKTTVEHSGGVLQVLGTSIRLSVPEIFHVLDEGEDEDVKTGS